MQDANNIPKLMVLHYKNETSFIEYIFRLMYVWYKAFCKMNERIVPRLVHTFGRKWRLLFRIPKKASYCIVVLCNKHEVYDCKSYNIFRNYCLKQSIAFHRVFQISITEILPLNVSCIPFGDMGKWGW